MTKIEKNMNIEKREFQNFATKKFTFLIYFEKAIRNIELFVWKKK